MVPPLLRRLVVPAIALAGSAGVGVQAFATTTTRSPYPKCYDQDLGKADKAQNGCSWYAFQHSCDKAASLADGNFDARVLCCTCGGGARRRRPWCRGSSWEPLSLSSGRSIPLLT
mmetsp:Transcript_15165/g.53235  ORF Transcript_15165/g.53235 Transcript_15165/m.53235 type:complete len:115 (+) Transcript_15165:44-388(+)